MKDRTGKEVSVLVSSGSVKDRTGKEVSVLVNSGSVKNRTGKEVSALARSGSVKDRAGKEVSALAIVTMSKYSCVFFQRVVATVPHAQPLECASHAQMEMEYNLVTSPVKVSLHQLRNPRK